MSKDKFIESLRYIRCQHDDCDNAVVNDKRIYCDSCCNDPKKTKIAIRKAMDRITKKR